MSRKLVFTLVCLSLVVLSLPAWPVGVPLPAQDGLQVTKSSCLAGTPQSLQPQWLTSSGCYSLSRCSDSDDCWSLCPEADSAACVNNVCQFTLPGGPGNPPPGNSCPMQTRCIDSSDCIFFDGTVGSCVSGICVC